MFGSSSVHLPRNLKKVKKPKKVSAICPAKKKAVPLHRLLIIVCYELERHC